MSLDWRLLLARTVLPAGVPLAWRQLTARRLRFAAAVAGIAFASVMMLMQLGFRDALYDSVVLLHRSFAGELVIVSGQYDTLVDSGTFSRRRLHEALGVPGVARAKVLQTGLAPWKNPETLHERTIFVVGCEAAFPALHLPELELLRPSLQRPDAVVYDTESRPEFGPVVPRLQGGERVATEIAGRRVSVGGTFRLGTSFAADGNVLAGEAAFHRLFPHRTPGTASIGVLELEPHARPESVQAALRAALPGDVLVLTTDELMDREKDFWARRTPIGFVFGAGVLVGFIVGAVIVYQILYMGLTDHLKEYAVLKATGCSDGFLHGVVVQQSVVLAVSGFIPASLLASGVFRATRMATSLPAHLDLAKSASVLSLTLAMCLLAGALALRVLRQADPADVF